MKEIHRVAGRYAVIEIYKRGGKCPKNSKEYNAERPFLYGDFEILELKIKTADGAEHTFDQRVTSEIYLRFYGVMNLESKRFESFYSNEQYAISQAEYRNKQYEKAVEEFLTSSV